MATILVIICFFVFAGMGTPSSLFGAAWPMIYEEFAVPVSYNSFVTVTVSIGTIVSSFMSARVIKRWGTIKVITVYLNSEVCF